MTLALLVGFLTVTAVVAGFLGWVRWPTRSACPECAAPTVPVAPQGLPQVVRRHAWTRWCPECGWEGLARRGPDLSDGPVDHGSGFRWNGEPSESAPTFHWAGPTSGDADEPASGTEPEPLPPSHASGFTWADPDDLDEPPDHPSGFRWRSLRHPIFFEPPDADSDTPPADDPSGFRWAKRDEER